MMQSLQAREMDGTGPQGQMVGAKEGPSEDWLSAKTVSRL